MAVSMDSAVLSHGSSNCPTAALGASTPSTLPRPCTRHVLPTCSGLRQAVPASRSLSYTSSAIESQRRSVKGIVCQQKQETLTLAGEVNDKTWSKLVIESDKPVLVDFWAPWCGPCRMIAPIVDEIAEMYKGRVLCLKLNTDESPLTATEYGIRSIPTVMIFKGGAKKDTIIGAVPKAALVTAIEKHLER